jgi:hypothetical protein
MPPALLLLGAGARMVLPIPLFLIWPLVALAWLLGGFVWLAAGARPSGGPRLFLAALQALSALRGLCIDVRGGDAGFRLRFL